VNEKQQRAGLERTKMGLPERQLSKGSSLACQDSCIVSLFLLLQLQLLLLLLTLLPPLFKLFLCWRAGGRRRAHDDFILLLCHCDLEFWPIARPLREALRLHSSAMKAGTQFVKPPAGEDFFGCVVVFDFVTAKIGVIHFS
jgi:hypothetical protein